MPVSLTELLFSSVAIMASPSTSILADEKKATHDESPCADPEIAVGEISDESEKHEVFKKNGEVSFRTVGWPRATVIFLKVIFATGVLSIPTAMVSLGAVGGAMNVIAWVSCWSEHCFFKLREREEEIMLIS